VAGFNDAAHYFFFCRRFGSFLGCRGRWRGWARAKESDEEFPVCQRLVFGLVFAEGKGHLLAALKFIL